MVTTMVDEFLIDAMDISLSEYIPKIKTIEQFCISMVVVADITEEDPAEGTQRYEDKKHLCKIMANYIEEKGEVNIPLDIFCKLGVLAEDYDKDPDFFCDDTFKEDISLTA